VRALDANGRLDVMLGKKNAQTVRDIDDVVRYVTTVPPGTLINTSGTTLTLMAAMAEAGATGALTGLPVPVATGLRQIIKMRQEGRTKAQINDALNALPPVQP
jgi:dihydrodipicolinate synthase/N-acetylneuraminate lyase